MFLYELVTCRQPFEGYDSVKEFMLDGGRPPITPQVNFMNLNFIIHIGMVVNCYLKEAMCPVYLLDLMALCWSQHPKDRPTASQIVSIATAPEFVHLLDVISLNHDGFVTDGIAVPIGDDEELHELWLCSTACQVRNTYSYFSLKFLNCFFRLIFCLHRSMHHTPKTNLGTTPIITPFKLTSTNQSLLLVWSATQSGWEMPEAKYFALGLVATIIFFRHFNHSFSFSSKTYQCLFRYALEPDAPSTAAIRRFINIPRLRRVAVALANGRLFLCRNDFIPLTSTQGEGTFVMTELGLGGSGTPLHCLAAVFFTSKE